MIQPDDRSPDLSLDLPAFLTRAGNACEPLRELLRIFKTEFPFLLKSLQEAVVRGDMKGVKVKAHTIKGMLANVSFAWAAASAACLEHMGLQGVTQGPPEELAGFGQEASLPLAGHGPCCKGIVR